MESLRNGTAHARGPNGHVAVAVLDAPLSLAGGQSAETGDDARCVLAIDGSDAQALRSLLSRTQVTVATFQDASSQPERFALLDVTLLCRRYGAQQVKVAVQLRTTLAAHGATLRLVALPAWQEGQPLADYLDGPIGGALALTDESFLDALPSLACDLDAIKPTASKTARKAADEDEYDSVLIPDWPDPPDPCVYNGLAGKIAQKIEPETEADPLAILAGILIGFGNIVGRTAHYRINSTRHHLNEFANIVGDSSVSRKGTGEDLVREVLEAADKTWYAKRIRSGLSTGEGLIKLVRDDLYGHERKRKGGVDVFDESLIEKGEDDKRLLLVESEFSSVLKRLDREANTVSEIICYAYDGKKLGNASLKSPYTSTGHHISLLGYIPVDRLKSLLKSTEVVSGFANRIMWLLTRSEKDLPFGGNPLDMTLYAEAFRDAIAKGKATEEMHFADDAKPVWTREYIAMKRRYKQIPGLLGHVLSRGPTHALRLAMIYSLLEPRGPQDKGTISLTGLQSALALWDYAERCATYLFGDTLGNPSAERILEALKKRGAEGLSRSEVRTLFAGHRSSQQIRNDLGLLLRNQLVERREVSSGGRPVETWFATTCAKSAKSAKSPGQSSEQPSETLPSQPEHSKPTPIQTFSRFSRFSRLDFRAVPPGGETGGVVALTVPPGEPEWHAFERPADDAAWATTLAPDAPPATASPVGTAVPENAPGGHVADPR